MTRLSARTALEYAITPAVLRLFAVILLGSLLFPVGVSLVHSGRLWLPGHGFSLLSLSEWIVGLLVSLIGIIALYGGLVALLYKIIADAVSENRE